MSSLTFHSDDHREPGFVSFWCWLLTMLHFILMIMKKNKFCVIQIIFSFMTNTLMHRFTSADQNLGIFSRTTSFSPSRFLSSCPSLVTSSSTLTRLVKIKFGLLRTPQCSPIVTLIGWFWELRKSVLLQTKCVRHLFCPLCHHGCLRSHRGGFCFTDRQALLIYWLKLLPWWVFLFFFLTKFALPSRCFSTHGSRLLTHGGSATGRTSFLIIDTLFLTFLSINLLICPIFWSLHFFCQ